MATAVTELIVRLSLAGHDLVELLPGGHVEQVGGAGVRAARVVVVRTDDGRVAADRDGLAEEISSRDTRRTQLEQLLAGGGVEQIGRAADVVERRADDGRVAADSNGLAEEVERGAILRQELHHLLPGGEVDDVGRARGRAVVGVSPGADDGETSVHVDRHPEIIEGGGIVRKDLALEPGDLGGAGVGHEGQDEERRSESRDLSHEVISLLVAEGNSAAEGSQVRILRPVFAAAEFGLSGQGSISGRFVDVAGNSRLSRPGGRGPGGRGR